MEVRRLKLLSMLLSLPKTLANPLVIQAILASTLKTHFSIESFKYLVEEMEPQQPETLAMVISRLRLTQLMLEPTLEIQNYYTQHMIREVFQVLVEGIEELLVGVALTTFYIQEIILLLIT